MFVKIVLLAFVFLEFSNVLAMYFAPGSRYANAVGVFTAWEKSKQHPEIHRSEERRVGKECSSRWSTYH